LLLLFIYSFFTTFAAVIDEEKKGQEEIPTINDPNLKVITVAQGLKRPTGMAFLGPNDFLVLEKNTGIVKRIVNGTVLSSPVLDVAVANEKERGMLGIAIKSSNLTIEKHEDKLDKGGDNNSTFVFLYYTESSGKDGNDDCPLINYCNEETAPEGNKLYRYQFYHGKLVNPELLLDLPASPGSDHIGGHIEIGPDANIYLISGDGHSCSYGSCNNGTKNTVLYSKSANEKNGIDPNGRGGILRVTQEGLAVSDKGKIGILGEGDPINKYYAYGIRNSFGFDFDPLTGKLWDTENGPAFGDEINLVNPGFNSGWSKIQGMWPITNITLLLPQGLIPPYRGYFESDKDTLLNRKSIDKAELVDFDGRGEYSDPEFIWNLTVGLTALKFLDSDKLGEKYENDLFVGDYSHGRLYHFDLDSGRTKLALNGSLTNKIAHTSDNEELGQIIFGSGFEAVTDLEVGPDGYLYVVSLKSGKIFKIVPSR
jgi:glucose/arabinose dehydrogenase